MGQNSYCDIPGNVSVAQVAFSAVASNAASATYPICRATYNGSVKYAAIIPSTSSASTTKTDAVTLINSGSAGTGTVVIGTFLASQAYASYKAAPISLSASATFSAGDVLSLAAASAAATTITPAGNVHIELTYY